jgi:hypothetical protein
MCIKDYLPVFPVHLISPSPDSALNGDGNVQIRCTEGRVLNMTDDGGANGFVAGGYFVIQCDSTSDPNVWITPASWPSIEACANAGTLCQVSDAPE